jgi:hypothetical protein
MTMWRCAVIELERVAARLRRADVLELRIGTSVGPAWRALNEAAAEAPAWHAELALREGDRRAAASFVAGWVASAPALVVGLPVLIADVVPVLRVDDIRVHRHPRGYLDHYAITPSRVRVGTGGDVDLDVAAAEIVRLTAPLVDGLCRQLPVGPAAVWGGVADELAGHALSFARETAADETAAWARAECLLAHLEARTPARARPRLFPLSWSGGRTHFSVRGTCCLYYRTCAPPRGEDDYCSTCPLRSDDSRTERLVTYLESTA